MTEPEEASIAKHFRDLPDPRVARTRHHARHDILVIARCAAICGADDWVAMAQFGRAQRTWFERVLPLPHGIPSHDTFGRVFAALDPEAFKTAFLAWVRTLAAVMPGDVIAIDAMGCQKDIARAIHAKGGDYVLSLKGNHGLFHDDIKTFFEVRRCWATEDITWLADPDRWPGLRTLVLVEAERTVRDHTTRERRLFISSLAADAARLARVVRSHWAIENSLHGVRDVAMNQDRTRIRKDQRPTTSPSCTTSR